MKKTRTWRAWAVHDHEAVLCIEWTRREARTVAARWTIPTMSVTRVEIREVAKRARKGGGK